MLPLCKKEINGTLQDTPDMNLLPTLPHSWPRQLLSPSHKQNQEQVKKWQELLVSKLCSLAKMRKPRYSAECIPPPAHLQPPQAQAGLWPADL